MKKLLLLVVMLSVAGAASVSAQPTPSLFVPLHPCRFFDSRADGGSPLAQGSTTYLLARGICNIPRHATAVAATVVAFAPAASGHLKFWAASALQPAASTMNFKEGATSSYTTALLCYPVEECAGEDVAIYVSQETHVILDVVGYFVAPATE